MNLIKALIRLWQHRNSHDPDHDLAREAIAIIQAEQAARAELLRVEQRKAAFGLA